MLLSQAWWPTYKGWLYPWQTYNNNSTINSDFYLLVLDRCCFYWKKNTVYPVLGVLHLSEALTMMCNFCYSGSCVFSWFTYQIQSRVALSIYTKYTEQTRMFSVVWQAWNAQLSSLVCISACVGLMLFMFVSCYCQRRLEEEKVYFIESTTYSRNPEKLPPRLPTIRCLRLCFHWRTGLSMLYKRPFVNLANMTNDQTWGQIHLYLKVFKYFFLSICNCIWHLGIESICILILS